MSGYFYRLFRYFIRQEMMNTRKRALQAVTTSSSSKKTKVATAIEVWKTSEVVGLMEESLLGAGNPSDAAAMKKYMREKFEFYGVKSPRRRELCKQVLHGKVNDIPNTELRQFVLTLWGKSQRELQYSALDILDKRKKKLCQSAGEFDQNIEFLKQLVVSKSWWDTVDCLASKIVGHLVRIHPNKGAPIMKDWIDSDNMWLRRTAILHQLGSKSDTDSELLFRLCLGRCHEDEFFIQKAIGWALRAYAHHKPGKVKTFLFKNKHSLSKLSYNEASKHLNMAKK